MTRANHTEVRRLLEKLSPGDSVWIKAPDGQPFDRILCQQINAVAYNLWGAGAYKMKPGKGEIGVIRKKIAEETT